MPDIDIRTLFYLFSAGNFFILLFFCVFIFINKKSLPIINIFIVANILLATVWLLFALRNVVHDFYSIPLANVLLIFSICYGMYVILFVGSKLKISHFLLLSLGPLVLSIIFIAFLHTEENTRVIVSSFLLSFIYLSCGVFLVINAIYTKMQKLAGVFSLILGTLFLLRAIFALFFDRSTELYTGNIQVISYMFLFLTSVSWTIVLLLILKELDEERIRKDNLKLNELNNSKDRFFSIIAHDLKNPIGAFIQLGQTLLEEDSDLNPKHRQKIIDLIIDSSKRTYNLLENLLQWALSESGRLTVEKSEISLNDIVNNNLLLSSEHIRQKKLKVKFIEDAEFKAYADYNMIETIVRNLLTNAIKYTRENGRIIIYADYKKDNFVELCVEDTGIGINKDVLQRIFDIDSNFKTKGTSNESGTGIGLKLCNEFAKKNGGNIYAISQLNKGSTFCISLPKAKPFN